jgi:hypothetical protein
MTSSGWQIMSTCNSETGWAPFLSRRRSDRTTFTFIEVLEMGHAREAFERLCLAGCNRDRLAELVMGIHLFSSRKAGSRPSQLTKKQVRTLDRVANDLKEIENWHPFPYGLVAEGDSESLLFHARVFHAKLRGAMEMYRGFRDMRTVNARDLRAAHIVKYVRSMTTKHRPHYAEVRELLDAELRVAGRRDLYNNVAAFEKAVTKKHLRVKLTPNNRIKL